MKLFKNLTDTPHVKLVRELSELTKKLCVLDGFIASKRFKNEPSTSKKLLYLQLKTMQTYQDILASRIEIFETPVKIINIKGE